jgi:hypothetical protein
MLIERNELLELLRSRGNDNAAERAEQSLPQHIDLHRDRKTLRQCGIDPNVLAFILSKQDRRTDVAEPLSESAAADDDAEGGSARVVVAPRTVRVRPEPSPAGSRTAMKQTNTVGQVTMPSSSETDMHADQTTTRATAADTRIGFSVKPRPAIRCPRCQFAFGSTDLMLDHLKADHLDADGFTHTSLVIDGVTRRSSGADRVVARQPAAELTDPEGAYRGANTFRAPRRLVIAVVLAYLLIVWAVAILA